MLDATINDSFALSTPLAKELYQHYAANLPIIDYHNHLDAKAIWQDHCAENLAQAWLYHDHYVWRAMRWNGIDEHFITGTASDTEKFEKWAQCLPYLIGNPLYQWSHLELKQFFDCHKTLNPQTWRQIWDACQSQFHNRQVSVRNVLKQCRVQTLCTTDSPCSDLCYHLLLKEAHDLPQVLPTFRADELMAFDSPDALQQIISQLTQSGKVTILELDDYLHVIEKRVQFFHTVGCRLADLGLPTVSFAPCSHYQAQQHFAALRHGQNLTEQQLTELKSYLFTYLGQLYHQHEWAMQLHIGVLANVNQRQKCSLGVGTGFSVINDRPIAEGLVQLLDSLERRQQLPKTIIYSVNPQHNSVIASICGAFQHSDAGAGKVQFGAAWWFNDHKDGIEAQLTTLKNLGSLGRFIGMLTDSRNIFSMSRHDYFRRILCNQLALWVEQGEIPLDMALLQQTIENICYYNALNYFNFPVNSSSVHQQEAVQ